MKELELIQEYISLNNIIELKPLIDFYISKNPQYEQDNYQLLCECLIKMYDEQPNTFSFSSTEIIKIAHFSKNIQLAIKLQCFWKALNECFYVYQDLTNNKLCVALLAQILELIQNNEILAHYKLFSDLFLLLDSFGTHITKDVWKKMDPFLIPPKFNLDSELKQLLIQNIKPIEILIKKAAAHTNEKTIKNCVKQLFKKDVDVNLIQELVVEIILPILNQPVFYKDTPLEGDSKFYPLVSQFIQKLPYIDQVIKQFTIHFTYPLAIGAVSVALAETEVPVSQESLEILVKYVKERIGLMNLRKRIQLANAAVRLFRHNQSPELLFELFKALPYESLKWRIDSQGKIGDALQQCITNEFRQKIVDFVKQEPNEIKELIILAQIDNEFDIKLLFGYVFQKISQIYMSAYISDEIKHQQLELLLNPLLQHCVNFSNEKQQLIYQAVDQVASELFAYITNDFDAALLIVENLWYFSMISFHEGDNLSKKMSNFIGHLFKTWFEKNKQVEVLKILNKILRSSNLVIFRAKYLKQGVYVEELILKYGLQVLQELSEQKVDRTLKNLYLHYMSNILTFHREVNHKPQLYYQQVQYLIENIYDIADSFNAYDYVTMFQLLQRVYSPEIVQHKLKHAKELKDLAISSFNNMMTVFGTHTNLNEILSYVDFVVDPCYFENEICTVVADIILLLLKQNQKQWVLLRKIVNNLVTCLYQYPQQLPHFQKVLLKLIKSNELRGYDTSEILPDQEQYVPLANKIKHKLTCKGEYYGAYPRFLIFGLLFELTKKQENHRNLISYIKFLIEQTTLLKHKNAYMQYTKPFRMKLHCWQNVCCLKTLLKRETFWQVYQEEEGKQLLEYFEQAIWKAFDQLNNPLYRQYMELMILFLMENYPEIWGPRILKTLQDEKAQVNLQIPSVFISCVFILHQPDHQLSEQLFKKVFPMVSSNVAYIRALCQTSCLQYIKKKQIDQFADFIDYFQSNRECIKIIKNIELLIQRYENLLNSFDLDGILALQFDSFGEIIHPCIIDILKSTCIKTIAEIKAEDGLAENQPPSWYQYVEKQKQQTEEGNKEFNFQRKINLIMDEFEFFKTFKPRSQVGDLIVVATLLEKIPNFGHLTRTSEIFGCKELVIPNKKIMQDEQYKAVSVSAEQHLPIVEVKEDYLMNYLILKKLQGYQLVALEQTSQSKQIQDFKFAEKTVLVLGREKTGLPIEYIELMDYCVEIPQFGVIRSLNVHISAVICIWQYVKQFQPQ